MSEQESGQVSEQEKEAIDNLRIQVMNFNEKEDRVLLNYINKLQKEIEKYKRLAKANLKDSQEFQDNMCNHRCIKNNEVLELKEELDYYKQKESQDFDERDYWEE